MNGAGYELVEHTGEIALRVRAHSLPELFAEAARALAELMAPEVYGGSVTRHVTVRARDREALLVGWLNEILYLADTTGRVFSELTIHELSDTTLRATVRGFRPLRTRTAVKAATYHDARIEPVDSGFVATVVLDV